MLHLATHGYFADPTQKSGLGMAPAESEMMLTGLFGQSQAVSFVRGFHPGMLSGLALTGANRAPQPSKDDGILTAQEIAFLPLEGVEQVVLSACETGLGPTAGGEGLLGVQRAFQIAGARTTVASLWKVDDQATSALMRMYYYKLWNENKPPVEALRESQLALYHHPEQIKGLATTRAPQFGKVLRIVERADPTIGDPNDLKRKAPVRQWAAFVLSGDWR